MQQRIPTFPNAKSHESKGALTAALVLLALPLCLLPSPAFAESIFDFFQSSPASDKSIQYLGQVFGNVGSVLAGESGGLMGQLFELFNTVVIALASIVLSYNMVVGTLNTAQEGKTLGRSMNSLWVPFRSIGSIALLVPSGSGYSMIQIMIMTIVLQGVHAANGTYRVVMQTLEDGTGIRGAPISVSDEISAQDSSGQETKKDLIETLFYSAMCQQAFNNHPNARGEIDDQPVTLFTRNESNGITLYVGIDSPASNSEELALCGAYQATNSGIFSQDADASRVSRNTFQNTQLRALISAIDSLNLAAYEAVMETDSSKWISTDPLLTARAQYESVVRTAELDGENNYKGAEDNRRAAERAVSDGWIFAGSYYFNLIKSSVKVNIPPPEQIVGTPSVAGYRFTAERLEEIAERYLAVVSSDSTYSIYGGGSLEEKVGRRLGDSGAGGLSIFGSHITDSIQRKIIPDNLGSSENTLVNVARMGGDIMTAVDAIFFGLLASVIVAVAAACVFTANPLNPASYCPTISLGVVMLMPVFIFLVTIMFAIGASFSILLPLIPYLTFMMAAVGWLILVLEAMISAPIIALALAAPSGDAVGRAMPSVMLITGVMLRPPLLVISFVVAAKVFDVAAGIIGYTFIATVASSAQFVGFFGSFVLLGLFGGLLSVITKGSFSLIYIIPDKILKWIGGQVQQSSIMHNIDQIERSSEQAAQRATGAAKGGVAALEAFSRSKHESAKEHERAALKDGPSPRRRRPGEEDGPGARRRGGPPGSDNPPGSGSGSGGGSGAAGGGGLQM